MVTRRENNYETLYRSIPCEGNSYGVNVYKRIDNRFYIYRTSVKNDFIQEEFVSRCISKELLKTFIDTVTKTTIN